MIYQVSYSAGRASWDAFTDIKKQLAFWYARPEAERPGYLQALEFSADSLEKQLARLSAQFSEYNKDNAVTWQSLRQELDETSAVIEFAEFQYYNGRRWTDSTYYIAYLIRKDAPSPQTVFLTEKKKLDQFLTANPVLVMKRAYGRNEKNPQALTLYDMIWKPLEGKLAGIKTIYFSPAGKLHKVSFAGLTDAKGELLNEHFRLIRLFSPFSATKNEEVALVPQADIPVNIYGGVQYNADSSGLVVAALKYTGLTAHRSPDIGLKREIQQEFNFLPGTLKEATTISMMARNAKWDNNLFSDLEANEESVKYLTEKRSPLVLHIATHAFFFPDTKKTTGTRDRNMQAAFRYSDNPLIRSGLVFSGANNTWKGNPVSGVEDGILTALEVSTMYLPNTKLVVLSACETGLGDIRGNEGVYGLQRAFRMAGVDNLVMSLWKVPDAETSEFMQEFYKNLFNKETISEAFYIAQSAMQNKYRNDPYKWAAWILVR
jgi:CHAT domain-containing protein